jgi:hypothetical protein
MNNNCGLSRWYATHLLILLFILISTSQGMGQKFALGVKAGASLTLPGFGEEEDKETFDRLVKPGFNAAVLIGFPLKNNYSLYIEAGASQKGRILTFNNNNSWKNNMTMRMTDMSMWLRKSYKFTLRKDTPGEFFWSIGPEINYWLSSTGFVQVEDGMKFNYEVVFGNHPEGATPESSIMTLENYNRWLFSLGAGVGLKAPITTKKFITVELRLLSGHTFLGKQDSSNMEGYIWGEDNMQDTMKTNLKSLTFTVAYTIDFDKVDRRKGKSTIKKKLKK